MTLKEMQNLDLKKATTKELEDAIKASYSLNKRIRNIQHTKNAFQGAVKSAMKSGGYFGFTYGHIPYPKESTTPQKYRAALQKEVARAQQFAGSKSSTVAGAREVFKNTVTTIFSGNKGAINKFRKLNSETQSDMIADFWSMYHRFQEENSYYPSNENDKKFDVFTVENNDDNGYNSKSDNILSSFADYYNQGLRDEELFNVVTDLYEADIEAEEAKRRSEYARDNNTKWSRMF